MQFQFEPIPSYGHSRLADYLKADTASTSYKSKETLAKKIQNATDIYGFVIGIFDGKDAKVAGFVLHNDDKKITDMFTFQKGRHNNLFSHIINYYKNILGWHTIEFEADENNIDILPYFKDALKG